MVSRIDMKWAKKGQTKQPQRLFICVYGIP